MKILSFFLFFWAIFPLLDPDPDPTAKINADPCGSGSETLVLMVPYLISYLISSSHPAANSNVKILYCTVAYFTVLGSCPNDAFLIN
jgi:hypothetical protein